LAAVLNHSLRVQLLLELSYNLEVCGYVGLWT